MNLWGEAGTGWGGSACLMPPLPSDVELSESLPCLSAYRPQTDSASTCLEVGGPVWRWTGLKWVQRDRVFSPRRPWWWSGCCTDRGGCWRQVRSRLHPQGPHRLPYGGCRRKGGGLRAAPVPLQRGPSRGLGCVSSSRTSEESWVFSG